MKKIILILALAALCAVLFIKFYDFDAPSGGIRTPYILAVFDDKILVKIEISGPVDRSCIYDNTGKYIGDTKNNFALPVKFKILGTQGRNIIYRDFLPGIANKDFYTENIDTGEIQKITIDQNLSFHEYFISEDNIYFKAGWENENGAFAKYNFTTGKFEYLPIFDKNKYKFRFIGVRNNKLYYYYEAKEKIEIYEYDINTEQSEKIAISSYYESMARGPELYMKENFIFIAAGYRHIEIESSGAEVRIFTGIVYGVYDNNFLSWDIKTKTLSLINIDTAEKQNLFSVDKDYYGLIGFYGNKVYYYCGEIFGEKRLPLGAGTIKRAKNINIYAYDLITGEMETIDKNIGQDSDYIFQYSSPILEKTYNLENRIVYLKKNKIRVKELK
jgi:hypothetical protein